MMSMIASEVSDGNLFPGTDFAKAVGFTSDKFAGNVWKKDNYVWFGYLISKQEGQGNLSKLINSVLARGYGVAVPSPSSKMRAILERKGFTKIVQSYYEEPFKNGWAKHYCERKDVWMKEPR